MAPPTTRKAEQSEATRGALIRVARELFATRGYADTPTEEVVRRAQVTRGALYYHFDGKQALFRAVCEDVQRDLAERLLAAAETEDRPEKHLERGCEAFLDACLEPDFQRIALLDAPSVLGWEAWHELDIKHGLGLIIVALEGAMEVDYIERQPVEPLAQVILGGLNEAGLVIARAENVERARADMGRTVMRLLEGLKPRAASAADRRT